MYTLYYAEASSKFAGPIYASLRPSNTSFFRRNVAAVASRWQHCVLFNPLQRRTRFRLTNWLTNIEFKQWRR